MRGSDVAGRSERLQRVLGTTWTAARHPRRAYHALHEGLVARPDDLRRFNRAMELLTGLDVVLSFERGGVKWVIPPGDNSVHRWLFKSGAYAHDAVVAVRNYIKEARPAQSCVVDVGANIGTTTIAFALSDYDVVAIEPVPETLRFLRANLDANGLQSRVHIVEAAICTGTDVVQIAVGTALGHSEVIDADAPPVEVEGGIAHTISVPAVGLSDAVLSAGVDPEAVAVVWSDTQASEGHVIETGESLWSAGVPLFTEFWPFGLDRHGGMRAFLAQAAAHFQSFITLDALSGGDVQARPVGELVHLADWVRANRGRGHTDVLLLPNGSPSPLTSSTAGDGS